MVFKRACPQKSLGFSEIVLKIKIYAIKCYDAALYTSMN